MLALFPQQTPSVSSSSIESSHLYEPNIRALLSEALSADVETVLSDQTSLVCANSAAAGALAVVARAAIPDGFVGHLVR